MPTRSQAKKPAAPVQTAPESSASTSLPADRPTALPTTREDVNIAQTAFNESYDDLVKYKDAIIAAKNVPDVKSAIALFMGFLVRRNLSNLRNNT
jgi:hypothetical protein